jgi:predicted O-linked N-acetylglucosamine transferase (SPINDLY family)
MDDLFQRGNNLLGAGRPQQALADFDAALALRPDHAGSWNSRGVALRDLGRLNEAHDSFSRALALNPGSAFAWMNRGVLTALYQPGGDRLSAIADFERAAAINPALPYLNWFLIRMRREICDWREHARENALLESQVRAGKPGVDPLTHTAISESLPLLQASAAIYGSEACPAQTPLWQAHQHDRIRIGYLSGDLREHATAHLMAGVFEHHDRARFEIWALDNTMDEASPMRTRLAAAFDQVLPVRGLSDEEAARRVAAAHIDILVNVNGYAGEHRAAICGWRPAPLQVNYLGFPGTLGMPYMDYILADPMLIRQDETLFYSEKVAWLPGSYQCNDDKRGIAGAEVTRAAFGLPKDGFVCCCINSGHKLTPSVFAVWMRLLSQVEGSVLWLADGQPAMRANLIAAAAAQGIARARLVFAARLPADRHLARLKLADLFLDTLPYNAHTSASDALWAGVPLLTCRGGSFASRVGASLLTAVGLPEMITENLADYEALALALARDPARLAALRRKLAANRLTTSLFDTAGFTRGLEAAYAQMWERHQRGEAPDHIKVS